MSILETLRIGLRGIAANRLRSSLTVLGILIGVAAVIVLVAVGNGSSVAVAASIEKLGTNSITIRSGSFGGPRAGGPMASFNQLSLADATALVDEVNAPDVKSVAPVKQTSVTCTFEGATHDTSMTGTWPSYFEVSNSPIGTGTYFTVDDVENGRRNIVVGQTVVEELLGSTEPIGATISCGGVPFTIVGVLAEKGSSGMQDADDSIIAPLTTVQRQLTGFAGLDSIVVQAASGEVQEAAQAQVTAILDRRHDTDEDSRDFQVLNQASLLTATEDTTRVFTVLLGAVAAISLLVGGIGITNIMLVTVTERTREIGIRKAIGASRGAILGQFLTEATVLSLIGGITGVVIAFVVTRFEIAGVQPVILPASVLGAFLVSVALGLFFGSYPANRAAALRPIEALRHE